MALDRFVDELRLGMERGEHRGVQACVSVGGERALSVALGEAGEGVAMREETAVLWMSAGKPATAVALGRLVDAGAMDWDDPVSEWVPGFEQNGKEAITVRRVLTHTGGFRAAPGVRYPEDDWGAILSKVSAARLEPGWTPGERAGYHVHTGWWALGGVLEAASGLLFGEAMRSLVLEPLGMERSWVTMPVAVHRGLVSSGGLAAMPDTSEVGAGAAAEAGWRLAGMESEAWCANVRPGGNAYGPAGELLRFYEMLLDLRATGRGDAGTLDGAKVLEASTAEAMVSRQREGMMDRTFRHVMDWGLGFMVNSRRHEVEGKVTPYGFGPFASDGAFGHGGSQCSVGMADPEHGLAAVILWNGQPGEVRHQRRLVRALGLLYEDLGLA